MWCAVDAVLVKALCVKMSLGKSRKARHWRASLLWRSGTTALQRRWLDDGASSNALSISLFAPMVDPVAK